MIEDDISVSAALGPLWASECNAKKGQPTFNKHFKNKKSPLFEAAVAG